MIARFEGPEGQRRLIEALKTSVLVEHDEEFAKRLADAGDVISFQPGQPIISQDAEDNDVYFLLVGEADVLINNRHVAVRKARESVGEMALLNPTERRSATIAARSEVVALKVTESSFHQVAKDYPQVWKVIAQLVSDRLRQRSSLLNYPNTRPVLFLGCSVESLNVAQEIQLCLKHDDVEVVVWTDGVFGASGVPLDDLLKMVHESDFAVFVISPDDGVISRGETYSAPRDNTVFELGLFMGKLERNRTFIVKEDHSDVKIPTDLLGITPLTYVMRKGGSLTTALAPVCTQLRKVVAGLGVR